MGGCRARRCEGGRDVKWRAVAAGGMLAAREEFCVLVCGMVWAVLEMPA